MTIKSKQELKNKLDEVAKKSLEKVALEVQVLWENYIQERFYDMYPGGGEEPYWYDRTYQLLNSIRLSDIKKLGSKWTINIFIDETSIRKGYKTATPMYVWSLAADGYHGNKSIQTEGRFFDELLEDLKSGSFYNEFERILTKEMGLKVIRK